MKKLITYSLSLLFILCCGNQLAAQSKGKQNAKSTKAPATQKGTLFFDKTAVGIGDVKDESITIPVKFTYKNISNAPVKIVNIKVGCNCMVAEWSKEPIAFNQTGEIIINFMPKGLSGNVEKNITVITDGAPYEYNLHFSGYINDLNARNSKEFPNKHGALWFSENSISFPSLFTYSVDSFKLYIYNSTDKNIGIAGWKVPSHIQLTLSNKYILPKERIEVTGVINASIANDYGSRKDELIFHTTDDEFADKKIIITTVISEDFSKYPEKFKNNPPIFEAVTPIVDLGNIPIKSVQTAEFTITNKGKSPMYIRKAYGSCGCTQIVYNSTKPIKRNKKATIKVTYSTNQEYGNVSKKIYIITNTPQQTQHELLLKGNIVLNP